MEKYGQGIYKIIRDVGGWCVAKQSGVREDGTPRYHRVSNLYSFRGWAQNFARRMRLKVVNYESYYA
jgi:hypothetical protein